MTPRRRRPLVALLGSAVLVLAACAQQVDGTPDGTLAASSPSSTPGPSDSPTGPAEPRPQFEECNQLLHLPGLKIPAALNGKITAECASVPVPLDYADPSAGRVNVTAVRLHDTDNSGDRPLFVNPGGPGGSALEFVLGLLPEISTKILTHYDLVGMDPRGVALSSPIECLKAKQKDALLAASPVVTTPSGFAAAKRLAHDFAAACAKNVGSGLRYFTTVNTARDMDRLRAALNVDTVDYLGFSYGTELGSVYAHLFPKRVGVAVLDGAVDPDDQGVESATGQLRGFEASFDQFAASCDAASKCASLDDPRSTAEAIERTALAKPLSTHSGRALTFSLAATGILEGLYSKSRWPSLGAALVDAAGGDGTGLLALADSYNQRTSAGQYQNILDSGTAVNCNDSPRGPSDATIRSTARDWTDHYLIFGAWFAISLFTCQQWQPHRSVPPKPSAATATKVLVVGNLHDPATPYQGAKDLTEAMGNAELLSWDGTGHTSYLSGSSCVDDYVNAYLLDKTLPPVDTTCPR